MHFKKEKGKIHLDMKGDLLLTKNKKIATCSSKSALPHSIKGEACAYVRKGHKWRATLTALVFIWSEDDD